MQLLIFILAAFGLGFWFSRSRAADRLTEGAQGLTSRLRRKPSTKPEKAVVEAEGSTVKKPVDSSSTTPID
jgi:hypothetical protein